MNVHAHTALSRLLDEPRIRELVRAYFDPPEPFAGFTFDDVGENPPDRITPSDLLAVSLLDVSFSPPAVRSLLVDEATWSGYLSEDRMPSELPLWEMDDERFAAADEMWRALVALPGVGPTKAGKLMARKRPHLIPIYDDVVGTFLIPGSTDLWTNLRAALSDDDLRSRVDSLADDLGHRPSTLRLIDVAVWMRNGASANAKTVR